MPRLTAMLVAIAVACAVVLASPQARAESDQTIYVLVNDEPISAFDVSQRVKLMRMQGGGASPQAAAKFKAEMQKRQSSMRERFLKYAIEQDSTLQSRKPSAEEVKALQDKFVTRERAYADSLRSRLTGEVSPVQRDKALAGLIGDLLKLQEAKRLDVLVEKADVDAYILELARRNEKSEKEFGQFLATQGISIGHFREQIRAQMAWRRVLSRRFRGQVSVGQAEIDSLLTAPTHVAEGNTEVVAEVVELQLQRISMPMSGKVDQAVMAARYEQAETVRSRIKGCDNLASLAKSIEGARHENLGRKAVGDLPEQARPMLANAEKGDVTPPILTASGIEIYAVCDKVVGKSSGTARDSARSKIESQKLGALSKGLLSDLCSSAFIEYRNGIKAGRSCGSE